MRLGQLVKFSTNREFGPYLDNRLSIPAGTILCLPVFGVCPMTGRFDFQCAGYLIDSTDITVIEVYETIVDVHDSSYSDKPPYTRLLKLSKMWAETVLVVVLLSIGLVCNISVYFL